MAVREGYKRTELGVIPEDWNTLPLCALSTMKSGEGITSSRINEHSIYPCYGGNGLRGYTSEYTHDGKYVLIGRQGALCGNVVAVQGKFFASEHAVVVTPNATTDISWLKYLLERMKLNRYAESSAQPGLSVSKILGLVAPAPPTKAEQEAIAEALSDADGLIESLEQLIAKKRQIKQGAMQELLTGKRRLPGFEGEWDKLKLGELGKFYKGSGVSRAQAASGPLPCIRYGELYTVHHDRIIEFQSWISEEVASTATKLCTGDILFAGSGETKEEIGKCAAFLHKGEAYAGGDIVIMRPCKADSQFLGYYLNTAPIVQQKASKGQGDAVVHISAASLSSIDIQLPSKTEQTAIATILSDMDTEITELEAKLTKARKIKQGMMQELLTGRIRLV